MGATDKVIGTVFVTIAVVTFTCYILFLLFAGPYPTGSGLLDAQVRAAARSVSPSPNAAPSPLTPPARPRPCSTCPFSPRQ